MGSRDKLGLARVRGLAHRRGVPGQREGARRLRQPSPWVAWPAAACGGPDTAGLGARLPLVRIRWGGGTRQRAEAARACAGRPAADRVSGGG